MGRIGPDGEFETITQVGREAAQKKKDNELDRPPAPQSDRHPTANTDPGKDPGKITVDEFYVEQLGAENLPGDADAEDYRAQARDGAIAKVATSVLDASGVDLKDFEKTVRTLVEKVTATRNKLDTKEEGPAPPAVPEATFEPLPGVVDDAVCRSRFDANDLALRGRKAVTERQFNQPLVMLDSELVPAAGARPWLLGQKLEFSQEWRHEGFTLGELVSSLSLLPDEELTIEVSSYQRTRQEIQTEQDDTKRTEMLNEQRNTDERSCTNQTAASNGWSVSATASVNYPVASASLSASANGNSSEQAEHSRRQLNEATSRASTDLSSRRAVKITQTTEAGSESTTTRRLRNPNSCQTVTFNFFQVIKLYDVQVRLASDRPVLLLPAIFPRFYGPQEVRKGETTDVRPTEVDIPAHLVEGWRSPAVFLTRYFEVDRELSTQISGWALRLRADVGETQRSNCSPKRSLSPRATSSGSTQQPRSIASPGRRASSVPRSWPRAPGPQTTTGLTRGRHSRSTPRASTSTRFAAGARRAATSRRHCTTSRRSPGSRRCGGSSERASSTSRRSPAAASASRATTSIRSSRSP
jgi:hypothetical protein